MEADRVYTKSVRIAELRYKVATGEPSTPTLEDRLELQDLVVRSDGPTLAEAETLLQGMLNPDSMPGLRFAVHANAA